MVKKLVVCFILISITFISLELLVYSTPIVQINKIEKQKIIDQAIDQHNKDEFFESLNFANELIPAGEKGVKRNIKNSLKTLSYNKVRSHKLHRLSKKWFQSIEPILAKHGIPEDFKYLPLVESGLKSGTSSKGASGYWQFMPETARSFGLIVNDSTDQRNDLVKSTEAACRYIKSLYREFGSWTLVAAAYNVGEGSLRKSMKNQEQDNYYLLSLNRETSIYVYKLISMKEIIEHPHRYGYRPASGKGMVADNGQATASNRL